MNCAVLEAYIESQSGLHLENRQIVYNDIEAASFTMRYHHCKVKASPLTENDLKQLNLNMDKDKAIEKTILFLAKAENQDQNFAINDLLLSLGVPRELHVPVFQRLFHSGYIKGGPALSNPIIWITPKGLEYAEELENKYFEEHQEPISPKNTKAASLDVACEILFQMHKNSEFKVLWTKSTYDNKPANLNVAKEVLLQKDIIYQKVSPRGHKTTHLNPEFFNASSYSEANRMLTTSKEKQPGTTINMRDGVAMVNSHSGNISAFNPNNVSHQADAKQNTLQKVIGFILNNIVIIIVGLITAYLVYRFGWN